MYYAKIDKYYTSGSAVFYHLIDKMDLIHILKHKLNQSETVELALERWEKEQHWLADWESGTVIDGFYPNCEVSFEFNSSRFYRSMKHDGAIHNVRNINAFNIRVIR